MATEAWSVSSSSSSSSSSLSSSSAASLRFASVAAPLGYPSTLAAGDAASIILNRLLAFLVAFGFFRTSIGFFFLNGTGGGRCHIVTVVWRLHQKHTRKLEPSQHSYNPLAVTRVLLVARCGKTLRPVGLCERCQTLRACEIEV